MLKLPATKPEPALGRHTKRVRHGQDCQTVLTSQKKQPRCKANCAEQDKADSVKAIAQFKPLAESTTPYLARHFAPIKNKHCIPNK